MSNKTTTTKITAPKAPKAPEAPKDVKKVVKTNTAIKDVKKAPEAPQALTEKEKDFINKAILVTDTQLKKTPKDKLKQLEKNLMSLEKKLVGAPEEKPVKKLIDKLEKMLDSKEAPEAPKAPQAPKAPVKQYEAIKDFSKVTQSIKNNIVITIDDNDQTQWNPVYIDSTTDTIILMSLDCNDALITSYKILVNKLEVRTNKHTFDILKIEQLKK